MIGYLFPVNLFTPFDTLDMLLQCDMIGYLFQANPVTMSCRNVGDCDVYV